MKQQSVNCVDAYGRPEFREKIRGIMATAPNRTKNARIAKRIMTYWARHESRKNRFAREYNPGDFPEVRIPAYQKPPLKQRLSNLLYELLP